MGLRPAARLLGCGLPGVPVLLRRWFAVLTWPESGSPAEDLDDEILAGALEDAWRRACDGASSPPPWQTVHRTAARHPLHPVAGTALDPPSAGIGGDNETIQNGAYAWPEEASFAITNLSVYRQVLDLADLRASAWIIPGGASGRREDPHYADQLGPWARHRLLPMRPGWEASGD